MYIFGNILLLHLITSHTHAPILHRQLRVYKPSRDFNEILSILHLTQEIVLSIVS